jgi:hypothetical protein
MFATIREKNLILGLIITLPDGRKLGGRYVNYGFASHFPADEQLHVGEAWEIDRETGAFIRPAIGSYGSSSTSATFSRSSSLTGRRSRRMPTNHEVVEHG